MILRETYDLWWPKLEEALMCDVIPGLAPYNKEEIWEMFEGGNLTLWVTDKSAILVEHVYYPRYKTLNLWASCGSEGEIFNVAIPSIVKWAEANGYRAITGSASRPAWARALNHIDGIKTYTTFIK